MGGSSKPCGVVVLALIVLVSAGSVRAEETTTDAAARRYFEDGRVAFERADYERALVYFRHAYRLSQRSELQYNIGVAADRLQREDEALEAFVEYLDNTDKPERETEVRERIAALRASIDEREATERALVEATIQNEATGGVPRRSDRTRLPTSTIAGGAALAAVGVAGVAVMGAGLARDGSCKRDVSGVCVTENSATAWTWVYGGLGLAALAGSASWFAVSHKRTKAKRETAWTITPAGLVVSGKF